MEVTNTLYVANRDEWRAWLSKHHATEKEVWLVYPAQASGEPRIPYLEAVQEALCFGWIDGIAKKIDPQRLAQRFTPRRPNSNWTELNKERARKLIASGRMTEAGRAKLPDLSPAAFRIADDILEALQADETTWANFQQFPEVYKRIRIGFIEEMRKRPDVFRTRLAHFLKETGQNKRFGTLE